MSHRPPHKCNVTCQEYSPLFSVLVYRDLVVRYSPVVIESPKIGHPTPCFWTVYCSSGENLTERLPFLGPFQRAQRDKLPFPSPSAESSRGLPVIFLLCLYHAMYEIVHICGYCDHECTNVHNGVRPVWRITLR